MLDPVRQKLAELVAHYGHDLSYDARRCESLLKDVCPQHKREIFVLVCAVAESVPLELLSCSAGLPKEVHISRLTNRLNDATGVAEQMVCRWAVESWALALGVAEEKDFRFPFKCPACDASRHHADTVGGPLCPLPALQGATSHFERRPQKFLSPPSAAAPQRADDITWIS